MSLELAFLGLLLSLSLAAVWRLRWDWFARLVFWTFLWQVLTPLQPALQDILMMVVGYLLCEGSYAYLSRRRRLTAPRKTE
jgi:hypothetical protein